MKTILTDLDTLYTNLGSWDAVAAALGVTTRTVRNWRSGAIMPPLSMVRLVAHESAIVLNTQARESLTQTVQVFIGQQEVV